MSSTGGGIGGKAAAVSCEFVGRRSSRCFLRGFICSPAHTIVATYPAAQDIATLSMPDLPNMSRHVVPIGQAAFQILPNLLQALPSVAGERRANIPPYAHATGICTMHLTKPRRPQFYTLRGTPSNEQRNMQPIPPANAKSDIRNQVDRHVSRYTNNSKRHPGPWQVFRKPPQLSLMLKEPRNHGFEIVFIRRCVDVNSFDHRMPRLLKYQVQNARNKPLTRRKHIGYCMHIGRMQRDLKCEKHNMCI